MCTSRPQISKPMEREIRRRCGFGCVMCGNPLYEYHHMKDWSMTHEHVTDDITLLCNMHHTEATNNLVTKEMVEQANRMPHNLKKGVSTPYYLHFSGNDGTIIVGSLSFKTNLIANHFFSAVLVDMISLIGFQMENGFLLIQLALIDEHNVPVLTIRNNELVYKMDNWDVQFVKNSLIVRRGLGDIMLDIVFRVPDTINIRRGELHANGIRINIYPDKFRIRTRTSDTSFRNSGITAPFVGIIIGKHPPNLNGVFHIEALNRYDYNDKKTQ